eukprot:Phypoly_transcript_04493.p2 GENE.Phypoly_transcript_04493~~Phypoly_transcript_04493.p2  ORF type:complete len:303 (-),score=70.76 Phypoly_transcript_04493:1057-1965(-)
MLRMLLILKELDIAPQHQDQIINYLNFARYKRNQHLREVDATFKDTVESRLGDDSYTQKEVSELISGLCAVVKQDVQKELLNTCHCNVLLLRQLMTQAEKIYLDLHVDTNELENQLLLKQVATFEESTQKAEGTRKLAALPQYNDKALQHAVGAVSAEKEKVQERLQKLQIQCTTILKEKTTLGDRVQQLEQLLKSAKIDSTIGNTNSSATADTVAVPVEPGIPKEKYDSLQRDVATLQSALEEKARLLKEADAQLTKKVNETLPFVNMKKMLKKKNEQIKEMRTKLATYEPSQNGDDVDDE